MLLMKWQEISLFYFYISLYEWELKMEYLSNPNQSRHQVQFFYWMLQGPAITSKAPGGHVGPTSELCVHAGLHRRAHTVLLTYCPSTNQITSEPFCLNFKFKGLGQMTSKTCESIQSSWTTGGQHWRVKSGIVPPTFPGSLSFVQSEP